MPHTEPDCREAFLLAIQKAALENPQIAPSAPEITGGVDTEDVYKMLAGFTADGNGGLLVLLTGREFTAKVLANIPNPDSYEVCARVADAIEFCLSMKDNGGCMGTGNFYTQAHAEMLLAGGVNMEPAPTYSCSLVQPLPASPLDEPQDNDGVVFRSDGPNRIDFDAIPHTKGGPISLQITDSSNELVACVTYATEHTGKPFTFYRADGSWATRVFPKDDENITL
jgi:hypothetical protein